MFQLSSISWPTLIVCPKSDTPLAFLFHWRGDHLFISFQTCSSSMSPSEKTTPSTYTIKVSAQEIPSLRLVTRLKRLISMNC